MKNFIFTALLLLATTQAFSQNKFSKHEISLNGFRNPSIGAEYRYQQVSLHGGYYLTNFKTGVTTQFFKTGLTYWFLPVGKKANPSSFYSSLSYARGLTKEYKNKNAGITEIGFRWMVLRGLNIRLGVAALAAKGKNVKINPTPGISYAFFLN
jgi:hypothetical protein